MCVLRVCTIIIFRHLHSLLASSRAECSRQIFQVKLECRDGEFTFTFATCHLFIRRSIQLRKVVYTFDSPSMIRSRMGDELLNIRCREPAFSYYIKRRPRKMATDVATATVILPSIPINCPGIRWFLNSNKENAVINNNDTLGGVDECSAWRARALIGRVAWLHAWPGARFHVLLAPAQVSCFHVAQNIIRPPTVNERSAIYGSELFFLPLRPVDFPRYCLRRDKTRSIRPFRASFTTHINRSPFDISFFFLLHSIVESWSTGVPSVFQKILVYA